MGLDEASARAQASGGSRGWAVVFALLGAAAAVAPFVVGAHAMWILLGVGTGVVCLGVNGRLGRDARRAAAAAERMRTVKSTSEPRGN